LSLNSISYYNITSYLASIFVAYSLIINVHALSDNVARPPRNRERCGQAFHKIATRFYEEKKNSYEHEIVFSFL